MTGNASSTLSDAYRSVNALSVGELRDAWMKKVIGLFSAQMPDDGEVAGKTNKEWTMRMLDGLTEEEYNKAMS
jgi:hypothetical protein